MEGSTGSQEPAPATVNQAAVEASVLTVAPDEGGTSSTPDESAPNMDTLDGLPLFTERQPAPEQPQKDAVPEPTVIDLGDSREPSMPPVDSASDHMLIDDDDGFVVEAPAAVDPVATAEVEAVVEQQPQPQPRQRATHVEGIQCGQGCSKAWVGDRAAQLAHEHELQKHKGKGKAADVVIFSDEASSRAGDDEEEQDDSEEEDDFFGHPYPVRYIPPAPPSFFLVLPINAKKQEDLKAKNALLKHKPKPKPKVVDHPVQKPRKVLLSEYLEHIQKPSIEAKRVEAAKQAGKPQKTNGLFPILRPGELADHPPPVPLPIPKHPVLNPYFHGWGGLPLLHPQYPAGYVKKVPNDIEEPGGWFDDVLEDLLELDSLGPNAVAISHSQSSPMGKGKNAPKLVLPASAIPPRRPREVESETPPPPVQYPMDNLAALQEALAQLPTKRATRTAEARYWFKKPSTRREKPRPSTSKVGPGRYKEPSEELSERAPSAGPSTLPNGDKGKKRKEREESPELNAFGYAPLDSEDSRKRERLDDGTAESASGKGKARDEGYNEGSSKATSASASTSAGAASSSNQNKSTARVPWSNTELGLLKSLFQRATKQPTSAQFESWASKEFQGNRTADALRRRFENYLKGTGASAAEDTKPNKSVLHASLATPAPASKKSTPKPVAVPVAAPAADPAPASPAPVIDLFEAVEDEEASSRQSTPEVSVEPVPVAPAPVAKEPAPKPVAGRARAASSSTSSSSDSGVAVVSSSKVAAVPARTEKPGDKLRAAAAAAMAAGRKKPAVKSVVEVEVPAIVSAKKTPEGAPRKPNVGSSGRMSLDSVVVPVTHRLISASPANKATGSTSASSRASHVNGTSRVKAASAALQKAAASTSRASFSSYQAPVATSRASSSSSRAPAPTVRPPVSTSRPSAPTSKTSTSTSAAASAFASTSTPANPVSAAFSTAPRTTGTFSMPAPLADFMEQPHSPGAGLGKRAYGADVSDADVDNPAKKARMMSGGAAKPYVMNGQSSAAAAGARHKMRPLPPRNRTKMRVVKVEESDSSVGRSDSSASQRTNGAHPSVSSMLAPGGHDYVGKGKGRAVPEDGPSSWSFPSNGNSYSANGAFPASGSSSLPPTSVKSYTAGVNGRVGLGYTKVSGSRSGSALSKTGGEDSDEEENNTTEFEEDHQTPVEVTPFEEDQMLHRRVAGTAH